MRNYGIIFFRLGIFLLPTAFFISVIFFLTSLFISFFLNDLKEMLFSKWNIIISLAVIFIIFICIAQTLILKDINTNLITNLGGWDPSLSWIGMGNWIPLFFCFFGFQSYLISPRDREIAAKILIAGSIPVLITGFGQLWFQWYGPISTLNDLIIWFQRPITEDYQGLSGLFNNQNYAGCWFNIIWPFTIAAFIKNSSKIKKSTTAIIASSISISIFLTSSRSAWSGLLIALPILFGKKIVYWFLIIFFAFFSLFFLLKHDSISYNLSDSYDIFNLNYILDEFKNENYTNVESRSKIFLFAIKNIIINPWIGSGAGSFPVFYLNKFNVYIGHTHNLFLELAFNYGLIIALLVFITILFLIYFGFIKIFATKFAKNINEIFFDKAWWASFFVLFCSQMVDIQYFDGRISIIFWLLLAGIKNIVEGKSYRIYSE